MSAELAIRNGLVFDGTGAPPRRQTVVVDRGRIVEVADTETRAETEIDATGLAVAPGFIDIHSHSDYTLLVDPRAVSALHQGVTLELIGNCGYGCFPIRDSVLATRGIYGYDDSRPLSWRDADGYFAALESAQPAVNVASLVPHGQLRMAALGIADRPANATELRTMCRDLEAALEAGAWGYSTGLEYDVERGSSETEVTTLCRVAGRVGGLYATHTRNRDVHTADAVNEAIRTSANAGARLQVSHLLPRPIGMDQTDECLAALETAEIDGQQVGFDMHTRLVGTTFLDAAVPTTVLEGERADVASRLRDPSTRRQLRSHASILSAFGDWSRVVLLEHEMLAPYARRSVAAIAAERDQVPTDTICDFLLASLDGPDRPMVVIHAYSEDDQRRIFAHPMCIPGSDATTLALDGRLSRQVFHGAYTWAAWYYRFVAREERVLSPEQAIHRLTGLPAEIMGARDRGVLRAGAHADIVVFDPERFGEKGTIFEPNQLATGMVHVFVNGKCALADGALTGTRPGLVLRRT